MEYINPPNVLLENINHRTFFSELYNHELGFNIYLPPDYDDGNDKYPVSYHLHGWTGNESSELIPLEMVYRNRRAITVFPNSSPVIEKYENLPCERMLLEELIPLIECEYRTLRTRESRSVTGFSMGGGFALYCAAKHPDMFSTVTAYAGTYHHFYDKQFQTVSVDPKNAGDIYASMINALKQIDEGNVLSLLSQNADSIRDKMNINLHIGTKDILYCDSEILRIHLDSLNIAHHYKIFENVDHELERII